MLDLRERIETGETVLAEEPPHRGVIIPRPQEEQLRVTPVPLPGVTEAARAGTRSLERNSKWIVALSQGHLAVGANKLPPRALPTCVCATLDWSSGQAGAGRWSGRT